MDTNSVIEIGTIIIALLGAIITYIVVPFIKKKTTKQEYENIEFWIGVAVNAAEQIFSEPDMGEKKKAYVIGFLKKMGIKISMDQLEVLIEAAVREINKNKSALT